MGKVAFATLLCLGLAVSGLRADMGKEDGRYVGGTAAGLKPETHGQARTDDEKAFVFEAKAAKLAIPYGNIAKLEFGEKTNTGVGYMGSFYPKKEHHHFLRLTYNDEGNSPQTAVFEIGPSRVWTTLMNLEKRTGRKVRFLDEKTLRYARKQILPGQTIGEL